ncbi:cysteine proteinase 1 [Aplysia californica]|uniref:Cysteine proteinase 1 n=1 Tax=Aplysia californica TaxID=6500 RepID=A0ABM1AEF7_APLCA|nr:cysteine proteinase 1 [Aplysia californica]
MALLIYVICAVLVHAHCSRPVRYEGSARGQGYREFTAWREQHGRQYSSGEELMRRYHIFVENLAKIRILNAERVSPDDATFGPTQFADLTEREFKDTVLMSAWRKSPGSKMYRSNSSLPAPPASFDWTSQSHVVTPVKNQGQAGTCWAFAGCANVESVYGVRTGEASPDLSTQALNDCDGYVDVLEGAIACGPLGATMPGFYLWVIEEGGLMSWEDYPYCVGNGGCAPCEPPGYSSQWCGGEWPIKPCVARDSCEAKYDRSKFVPGIKVKDFVNFPSDESALVENLVEVGPLVAGIDATDMQLYTGGVLQATSCRPEQLNHAVLLVGYGQAGEGGAPYWRAKNSWGEGWGEEGYLRIQRGEGACGINTDVTSAVLD